MGETGILREDNVNNELSLFTWLTSILIAAYILLAGFGGWKLIESFYLYARSVL